MAPAARDEHFQMSTEQMFPTARLDFSRVPPTLPHSNSFRLIMQLNNDEIRRYSRHLILPEVGLAGQKKLKAASVLCIGAGGLGSPIALYLDAAGIGKLGIVGFHV